MKSILVISHAACEHAGYLCEYLNQRNISYERIRHEQGESIPGVIHNLSGLVFLGSPVSVNDSFGWIKEEIALIKSALLEDIPVLGICFGAQAIARALGAQVIPASSMQIGWHTVRLTQQGNALFDDTGIPDHFLVFEWHGDTFSLPGDATPVFTGADDERGSPVNVGDADPAQGDQVAGSGAVRQGARVHVGGVGLQCHYLMTMETRS